MRRWRGSCFTLRDIGATTDDCCSSCHNEEEEGYSMLMEHDLPNGDRVEHCCAVEFVLDDDEILRRLDAHEAAQDAQDGAQQNT